MKPMRVALLSRLYETLLRLYPRNFRSEFADEMREAFWLEMKDAGRKGSLALGQAWLRELGDMPASILQAYRQVGLSRQAAHTSQDDPLAQSWKELVLALTVFLLPAVIVVFNQQPPAPDSPGLTAAFLFLLVMVAIGWLGGFPLWSRLYLGIVLVIAGYLYLFMWVANLINPALISNFTPGAWDRSTYLMLEAASTGMMWMVLFCLTLLLVALLAVFGRFQQLFVRVRQDWTLLSYILYGESLFALMLFQSNNDELSHFIASLLCMAAGIWFFQRGALRWERLLALVTCLTLAVGIASLDESQLASSEEWLSVSFADARRMLLSWIWMVAALVLPGLLARLRLNSRQLPPSQPDRRIAFPRAEGC